MVLPIALSALALGASPSVPPVLVPWSQVGNITLGESRARYLGERHRGDVTVTFYNGRVSRLVFSTPYYRTASGFGVGSRIPVGTGQWRGFVWNKWIRETPCNCWTKVGLGKRSLPVSGANFTKPWFFIYMRHGRVRSFVFDLRFVD